MLRLCRRQYQPTSKRAYKFTQTRGPKRVRSHATLNTHRAHTITYAYTHTPWGKVTHSTTPPATTPKRAMPKIWLGKRMVL